VQSVTCNNGTAKFIVHAQGDHVDVLANPMMAAAAPAGTEKELFELPIKRRSYSIPADQFGVKPYSKPTPMDPPQRVEVA